MKGCLRKQKDDQVSLEVNLMLTLNAPKHYLIQDTKNQCNFTLSSSGHPIKGSMA